MNNISVNSFFGKKRNKEVVYGDTYKKLVEKYEKIRNMGDFGGGYGGNHMCEGNGIIKNSKGEHIANMSYNGRVWDLDGNEISI